MQLYSGIELSATDIEPSAYQQALRSGGYCDDLEIQVTTNIVRRICRGADENLIYDIGAQDGLYSLSYRKSLPHSVLTFERNPDYHKVLSENGIVNILQHPSDLITHRIVDLIRVNYESEILSRLKELICWSMPAILLRDRYIDQDLIDQILDLGYSYYCIVEDSNPFLRLLIHQMEKTIRSDFVKKIDKQENQTLLFYVPGSHIIDRCRMAS